MKALSIIACAAMATLGCGGAVGRFRAEGTTLKSWTLEPDSCRSALHNNVYGADLYRQNESEDTELVIATPGLVLVRIPGEDHMVLFTKEDCRVLDYDMHGNGVRVNGIPGIAGTVRLECERPSIGRISGTASFTCY